MIGLDTNVLIRYLVQDDPIQTRQANALIGVINELVGCETTRTFDRSAASLRAFKQV